MMANSSKLMWQLHTLGPAADPEFHPRTGRGHRLANRIHDRIEYFDLIRGASTMDMSVE